MSVGFSVRVGAGFVPISNSCVRDFFDFDLQVLTFGDPFNCAETIRKRMATPITTTTRRPPPMAAPIREPVAGPCGEAVPAPAATPPIARIEGVGDEESVGPGVSVGVTEGEAPMRRVGVGLGVSVGVTDDVIDEVGVGV